MTIPRTPKRTEAGFTLIELSIVIVLIGILLTLGLAAFNAQLQSSAGTATRQKQQIIKDALIAYLRDNRRLPCPEISALNGTEPTGIETRSVAPVGVPDTTSVCASYWGTVPYTTLGIGRDIALDGYGSFFSYFVSAARTTNEPDWTITQGLPASAPGFSVGNPGRLAVTENGVSPTLSSQLAAVVLISHGPNGNGALTVKGTRIVMPDAANVDELSNTPGGPGTPALWVAPSSTPVLPPTLPNPAIGSLVTRDRTEVFDDIVMALRPNDLLTPLIKDGALKSAPALLAEQFLAVTDAAIVSFLPTACTAPATLSGLPLDPWGMPIVFSPGSPLVLAAANSTSELNQPAFSVTSYGPDRANATGDDIIQTLSYGQVRARIPLPTCS